MRFNRVLRLLVIGALVGAAAGLQQTYVAGGMACEYDPKKDVCIDLFCEINQGECLLPVPPSEECLCQLGGNSR